MAYVLVFEFPSTGPFGDAAVDAYRELALDIAGEPGLVRKVWTEDAGRGVAGGVYLFDTKARADAYAAKHSARLQGFGIVDIDARGFDVNEGLSELTRGRLHG